MPRRQDQLANATRAGNVFFFLASRVPKLRRGLEFRKSADYDSRARVNHDKVQQTIGNVLLMCTFNIDIATTYRYCTGNGANKERLFIFTFTFLVLAFFFRTTSPSGTALRALPSGTSVHNSSIPQASSKFRYIRSSLTSRTRMTGHFLYASLHWLL